MSWYIFAVDGQVRDVVAGGGGGGASSNTTMRREDFSLLSDIVPEDKELRRKLQMDRLEQVRLMLLYSTGTHNNKNKQKFRLVLSGFYFFSHFVWYLYAVWAIRGE